MQDDGCSLLEVMIAVAILCLATLGVAQLLGVATEAIAAARVQTMTAAMASARIEQLRSLVFEYDDEGGRVTDTTTNLSTEPAGRDGPGLSGAAADSLFGNVNGFVDYLDRHGRWVGRTMAPPADAAFVRRWAVDRLGGSPDLLVLRVLVRPLGFDAPGEAEVRRARGESRVTTILARAHR